MWVSVWLLSGRKWSSYREWWLLRTRQSPHVVDDELLLVEDNWKRVWVSFGVNRRRVIRGWLWKVTENDDYIMFDWGRINVELCYPCIAFPLKFIFIFSTSFQLCRKSEGPSEFFFRCSNSFRTTENCKNTCRSYYYFLTIFCTIRKF